VCPRLHRQIARRSRRPRIKRLAGRRIGVEEMTGKEFVRRIANGKKDLLQEFLDILRTNKIPYCIIGGLAVNAYAEPVVSLDLDVVIATAEIHDLLENLPKGFKTRKESHSMNISASFS